MKYKDIAEKNEISLNTVKSWKQRHGWVRNKGVPSKEGVHTKKRGALKGKIKAIGNSGESAPKGRALLAAIEKEVNPHFEGFLFDWNQKFQFLVGGYGLSKSYHVALKLVLKLLEEKRTALD